MTNSDLIAVMESPLFAIAEADIDVAPILFDRFFAAFPEHRVVFINPVAARGRMTNETIEAMMGLATDEYWVPTTIVNFVDLHSIYGNFPASLYAAFIDLLVDTLADAAGAAWTSEADAAWRTQARRLKSMIGDAIELIS